MPWHSLSGGSCLQRGQARVSKAVHPLPDVFEADDPPAREAGSDSRAGKAAKQFPSPEDPAPAPPRATPASEDGRLL